MAVFPFENGVANDAGFAKRQEQYMKLLASDVKPFDFMVRPSCLLHLVRTLALQIM